MAKLLKRVWLGQYSFQGLVLRYLCLLLFAADTLYSPLHLLVEPHLNDTFTPQAPAQHSHYFEPSPAARHHHDHQPHLTADHKLQGTRPPQRFLALCPPPLATPLVLAASPADLAAPPPHERLNPPCSLPPLPRLPRAPPPLHAA